MNEWMCFMLGNRCEFDGKTYYSGHCFKFNKDTDVYLKESTSLSNVYVSHKDSTKLTGSGYGWMVDKTFMKLHHFTESVTEDPGKEVNLELDESFIPKGMKFDKWETVGDITIKDPTSKKTSFIMPKNELGKAYEIYATYKPIVPLQFEKESIELNKSERSQLTVTGDYETLTWSSSDPTTVQVDQNGHIHAIKSGKATITVKDESGKKTSCVVTVTNKLKSLSLNENNVELKGQTEKKLSVTLTPSDADDEKLTWTSSNEGVAKVSEDGTLTIASCGEATITVESKSGLTDRCKVVVVHDWKLDSKVDATVDKEGKKVYKCTLCHETKEETIPRLIGKWVTDSHGKWYQYSDGTFEKSGFKEIDGKTYYFQSNGYLQVGWLSLNNDWYMFDSEGVMITGWNGSYYFDENGKMMTNAFTPDHYYVGSSGAYLTNCWFKHNGKDYYADNYGHIVKNKWIGSYYLGSDGTMVTNTFTPDGYYCGPDGAYVTNCWVKVNGKYYYMNAAGTVTKNSWIGSYYLGNDGAMLTNTYTPDGYYVGLDGLWTPAKWIQSGNKWWYRHSDGSYTTNDFEEIGNQRYYFDSNGYMVTGWQCISGQWYYFDSNGFYQTGEHFINGEYYYFNNQGIMQTGYAEDGWEYNSSGQRIVYWSSYSTNPVYHRTPHNIKQHNLVRGTYSQAVAAGKTNYCKTC